MSLLQRLSLEVKSFAHRALKAVVLVFSVPKDVECSSPEVATSIVSAQTGFVFGDFVVTAAHGVSSGKACIAAEGRILNARLAGIDDKWDLAFLEVPKELGRVHALELDRSAEHVGELVIVVGMNRGSLNPYVSIGVVCSEGVSVKIQDKTVEGVMQVHTYVPRGTSGSPVLGSNGKIVGMIIGVDYGGSIAYAVPAQAILNDYRLVSRGISPSSRIKLGVKVLATRDGLMVLHVKEGSVAWNVGLRSGDVIRECYTCGKHVKTISLWDLWSCIDGALLCGEALELTVAREGNVKRVKVST